MFFYISFLRPPPCQAAPYSNIVIAPQIANDLRTEQFEGSQDIFYIWSQEHPSNGPQKNLNATKNPLVTTWPRKLTTWRQANAYKEIPVPLPPNVREGQHWRLFLTGTPHAQTALEIDMGDEGVGKHPLPVMSMPILFTARCGKGAQKQEHVERVYRFPRVDNGRENVAPLDLKITEQTSFDLDKKIWDSGIGLSSWLVSLSNHTNSDSDSAAVERMRDALFSSERRTILELGAGTGIVSLAIAGLRSVTTTSNAIDHVFATDVSSAMPLLEQNVSNNQHIFSTLPKATVLDWDDEDLPLEVVGVEDGLDAIVMADVTYNTASFPSLIRTLGKLVRLGSKMPAILLGYKERDAAERTLWDMAAQIGIEFEKVGQRVGAGGAPVEIWIGHVQS